MDIIDRIFADNPPFHRINTEVPGEPSFEQSALPPADKARREGLKGRQNWGICENSPVICSTYSDQE